MQQQRLTKSQELLTKSQELLTKSQELLTKSQELLTKNFVYKHKTTLIYKNEKTNIEFMYLVEKNQKNQKNKKVYTIESGQHLLPNDFTIEVGKLTRIILFYDKTEVTNTSFESAQLHEESVKDQYSTTYKLEMYFDRGFIIKLSSSIREDKNNPPNELMEQIRHMIKPNIYIAIQESDIDSYIYKNIIVILNFLIENKVIEISQISKKDKDRYAKEYAKEFAYDVDIEPASNSESKKGEDEDKDSYEDIEPASNSESKKGEDEDKDSYEDIKPASNSESKKGGKKKSRKKRQKKLKRKSYRKYNARKTRK